MVLIITNMLLLWGFYKRKTTHILATPINCHISEMTRDLSPINVLDTRHTMRGLKECHDYKGYNETEHDAEFTALLYNLYIKKTTLEILSSPRIGNYDKMIIINKYVSKVKGIDIRGSDIMDDWDFDIIV